MEIVTLRHNYGDSYATVISNDIIIPWRLLTTQEFIDYEQLIKTNKYPLSVIQDEIFNTCVLDEFYKKKAPFLSAGIVGAVAEGIWSHSGPINPVELEAFLSYQRNQIQNIMHQMVSWICQAFPAYKPEDVYDMDYPRLLLRFAQAEDKLLKFGLITEPFNFSNDQAGDSPTTPNKPTKPKVDLNKLRQEFEKQQQPKQQQKKVFRQVDQGQTIITAKEMQEHEAALLGHEKDPVHLHKVTQQTADIYKDYLEQFAKDGKIVMKTDEERLAEAKARMEANKNALLESAKKQQEFNKNELEELKRRREEERKRREKRKTR